MKESLFRKFWVLLIVGVFLLYIPAPTVSEGILDELPSHPSPSTTVVSTAIDINVVFVGVPEDLIDINIIKSELPEEHAPIVRMKREYLGRIIPYVYYTLNYHFYTFSEIEASNYAQWLTNLHEEHGAPIWLQESGIYTAWYIREEYAEAWFDEKYDQYYEQLGAGYTLFIVDTYHTAYRITDYYFYNLSRADVETGLIPGMSGQFAVAFGGDSRYLVLDLSAGPTQYVGQRFPYRNIWQYSSTAEFSGDIAFYIRSAVELRFLSSLLYPAYWWYNYILYVNVFNNESDVDYAPILEMNKEYIEEQFNRLLPFSNFRVIIQSRYVANYEDLWNLMKREVDPDTGELPSAEPFKEWVRLHKDEFVPEYENTVVIPVFVFAGMKFRGGLLGEAVASTENGELDFIIVLTNRGLLGLNYETYLIDRVQVVVDRLLLLNENGYVSGISRNGGLFLLMQSSGEIGVIVTDKRGYDELITIGSTSRIVDQFTVNGVAQRYIPNVPTGSIYYVFTYPITAPQTLVCYIFEAFRAGYGMATTMIHEVGHGLGLSHPHDGYSWSNQRDYVYWIWDFSDTPMTYAVSDTDFDQLDYDTLHRAKTCEILNYTYLVLDMIDEFLTRRGYGVIPSKVLANYTNSVHHIEETLANFTAQVPRYVSSLFSSFYAFLTAWDAYTYLKDSLLTYSLTLKSRTGKNVEGVEVTLTLPNGSSISEVSNADGVVDFINLPWGTFTVTCTYHEIEVYSGTMELTGEERLTISETKTVDVYDLKMKFVDMFGLPAGGATVTVRLPHGEEKHLTADSNGIIIVENVEKGRFSYEVFYFIGETSGENDVSIMEEVSEIRVNVGLSPISLGVIVGIVIILMVIIIFFVLRRRRKPQETVSEEVPLPPPPPS